MSKKVKNEDLYNGGDPNALDTLGRQMAYCMSDDPMISAVKMAEMFKCNRVSIDRRLKSKDFKAFQIRLESSLWDKIAKLRYMASLNAEKYLKKPDSNAGLEMTKMFLKNAAEHQSTLPAPESGEPEFVDDQTDV